jgi:hypothetical protein
MTLTMSRQQVEDALRAAHDASLPLRRQLRDLDLLMAQARTVLDLAGPWIPWPPLPGPDRPPTLHEAMRTVLVERSNRWMTPRDLARAIARRGLYRRRDGLPPTVNQVSARASSYAGTFERDGWVIRLRCPPPGCASRNADPPQRRTR